MKIIYCFTDNSSFVQKDLAIFESIADVVSFRLNVGNKYKLPFEFLKQFFFLIRNISGSSVLITQFAGYHSVLPVLFSKIFSKKSVIVLGGTDCVSFPSIGYGNFNRFGLNWATSFSIKKASHLLPVDDTLVYCNYSYSISDFQHQGFLHHLPLVETPYTTIYNGFEVSMWPFVSKKKISFATVIGSASLGNRFKLKGGDLFIEIAKKYPDYSFYIVGSVPQDTELPSNVYINPFIPNQELAAFFADKKYYLQLSMSEGFPNALAEAMLCGCIPIVSSVGAMPFIVQNENLVLKKKSIDELQYLIEYVLKTNIDANQFRERIELNFSLEKRKKEMKKLIQSILASN